MTYCGCGRFCAHRRQVRLTWGADRGGSASRRLWVWVLGFFYSEVDDICVGGRWCVNMLLRFFLFLRNFLIFRCLSLDDGGLSTFNRR